MFKILILAVLSVNIFAINITADQYNSKQWKALFHYNNENDSSLSEELFFSKEKTLKSEMEFLLNNRTQENICKVPARYNFLKKEFKLDSIDFSKCDDLSRFLNDSNASSASVVYVSSFLSSPSSFFGHLFLKLNKKDNLYFSQTVNYAAEVPKDTGGIELMTSGVSGKFQGNITLSPYFKIIESYNVNEQRDMEEYELKLNKDEMQMLLYHIYEMYGHKNSYRFFGNNCSTEILWAINAAAPQYELSSNKKNFDSPFNILKYLDSKGIVNSNVNVRASMLNDMFILFNTMSNKEKNDFSVLINIKNKIYFIEDDSVPFEEKAKLATLLNLYYDFMFKKMNIVYEDWNDVKSIMHKYQSKIEKKQTTFNNKYESYILTNFVNNNQQIEFSPALINKSFDFSSGMSETSLQFLDIVLNTQKSNKLEKLDLIKIESLNDLLPFYKQPSWRGRIGISQDNNNQSNAEFEFGAGVSYSYADVRFFIIPQVYLSSNINYEDLQLYSGLSYWITHTIHFNVDYKTGLFETNKNEKKLSLHYNLKNIGLNCGFDDVKKQVFIGAMYRF